MERIVIDVSTGESVVERLSDEEVTALATLAEETAARTKAAEATVTQVRQAQPGAAIVQKLRDGTALTAGELQAVVRWLALRAVREIGSGA